MIHSLRSGDGVEDVIWTDGLCAKLPTTSKPNNTFWRVVGTVLTAFMTVDAVCCTPEQLVTI